MHFSRLDVVNFGPIESFSADLAPKGLSVIVGPNGAGKTHVLAALLHSVLGARSRLLTRFKSSSQATEVRLMLDSGGVQESATTYAVGDDSTTAPPEPKYNTVGRKSLPRLFANMRGLLGNPSLPRLVLDAEVAGKTDYAAGVPLGVLEDLPLRGPAADAWRQIRNHIMRMPPTKWSLGEHALLDYALEFDRRRGGAVSLPLLVDEPFGRLDTVGRELALAMLSAIAEQDQVIVLECDHISAWPSRNPARLLTLGGGRATKSTLGLDGFAYGSLTRLVSTGLELDYIERLTAGREGRSVTAAALNDLRAGHQRILAELGALREEFRAGREAAQVGVEKLLESSTSLHTSLADIGQGVKDIQSAMALLVARSQELMESLAPPLEDAIMAADRDKIEATCDDIARRVVNQIRKDLSRRSSMDETFRKLRDEFSRDWDRLSPTSQKDVALSRLLQQEAELEAHHLAILQICRAVEGEIMLNVFGPFRDAVRREQIVYPENDAYVVKDAKRSYKLLHDFAVTETGKLTLGQFGWIVKTAKEHPNVPLFQALLDFLASRFLDKCSEVMARLLRISVGHMSELDPAAPHQSMSDVRNACAHPPSLAGDHAAVTGEASFSAIWRFALLEPIEFLLLLARSSKAEG